MALVKIPKQTINLTAAAFIEQLSAFQSNAELEKIYRYFKTEAGDYGAGDEFMGVRMGQVFEMAKAFMAMRKLDIEQIVHATLE